MFFQISCIFNINKFIFQKTFCYFAALNTLNRNRRHKTRDHGKSPYRLNKT